MSHKLFPSILLACALFAFPAFAQPGAAPAAPHAGNADVLTPDQAKRALETLQDDKKRAQMIDTLRAIAKASPQAQAAAPAAEPQSAIPLTEDSLGAQVLLTVSEQVGEISREIADVARTLTHYQAFYYWFLETANDPSAYRQLLDIAWKLALVFGCAFAAEWLIFRLIKRPVALLEARLPRTAVVPVQTLAIVDPPSSVADVTAEPALHRRRLSLARAWQSLVRLPFVLGHLMLELLPVFVFSGVAAMLLGTEIGNIATTRLVILAVVNAYALSRGLICLVRALAGPFGLIRVRAETAAYIEIWARRIVWVGVSGIALANVALLLGLHRAGYGALLRLVMLVVHLFTVVIILQCRRQVAEAIRAPAGREGVAAKVRNRVAVLWHYVAIALDLALWAVWAMNIRNGYSLLLQYFVGTIAVALIARLAIILVLSLIDRGFRISPDILQRFPGLETRANRYLPLLRNIVSAVIAFIGFVALLEVWGVDAVVWFYGGQIGSRLLSAVVTIGIAAFAAAAIWEISNALLDRQVNALSRDGHYARAARLRTFQPMVRTALLCLIVTVVGLTALSEIGVNVAPLLAGAGIVGIAIGFGSQKLVQDLITGLFRGRLPSEDPSRRAVSAAGEYRSGRRQRQPVRPVRHGGECFDSHPSSAGRRRRGAHRSLQRRDDDHQFKPRRRQCRRQRQRGLQGRHRPGRSNTQGHRRRDASRARISACDPRRSRIVGRRQGGRRDGVDRRPDQVHRQRSLAGTARVQPPHEAAIPGLRNRNRFPWPDHSDAGSRAGRSRTQCDASAGSWLVFGLVSTQPNAD